MEHADGDAVLAKKIATRFLESVPALLTNIDKAAQSPDADAFVRHAHTLKGAAATLGGYRSQAASLRLETTARGGDLQTARGMIAEVKREVAALEQALREFVEE
jgi:HPt (histidine-containing phosphotransfer) domain-containing protein